MSGETVSALFAPFWDHPDRAGVFCDFDGTLAPIVEDPAEARPHPKAVEVLDRLGRRFARVGVVSGRPLAFLDDRLGGHGLTLSGLYGLETRRGDEFVPDEEAERWRPAVTELIGRAPGEVPDGVHFEPKGLSVVVHFRTHPASARAAEEWAETEAARTGLVVHPGRMSFELRPPVATSKGSSVAAMLDGVDTACFLGDDTGDLPAFDALDELAARGGRAVRVAVESEEAPAELLERADLVADGPGEVVALLARLASGP
jgi:trehalose 6-phosphate phosphatase